MVSVNSTMLPLGTPAPDFALPDPAGEMHRLADFADAPALVIAFICNHCPYVKHIAGPLATVTTHLAQQGAAVVAVSANDADAYPDDAPDEMADEAAEHGWEFPYLHDESQQVAQAYRAACTPDFFVFDGDQRLVYRGQFDSSRPTNDTPATGRDLTAAVEAVLAGRAPSDEQFPSIGCNIKWKPGNEPDYFG